jgi:RNA polymerase sigma-70 factor (ECF subfamily)
LLEAARAGDRPALERLLSDHYDRIYAVCRRMLGNEADALDAAQDALLSAVRALDRFDGRSSFGTWLYRIATNACLDELRRRRRRPVLGLAGEGTDDDALFETAGRSAFGQQRPDPADEVSARLDLDAALRSLAPEHRVAVVLRDVADLTYEDIAVILDVPIGTVRSRISRGRAVLADLLTDTAGTDPDTGNSAGVAVVQPGDRTDNRTP